MLKEVIHVETSLFEDAIIEILFHLGRTRLHFHMCIFSIHGVNICTTFAAEHGCLVLIMSHCRSKRPSLLCHPSFYNSKYIRNLFSEHWKKQTLRRAERQMLQTLLSNVGPCDTKVLKLKCSLTVREPQRVLTGIMFRDVWRKWMWSVHCNCGSDLYL